MGNRHDLPGHDQIDRIFRYPKLADIELDDDIRHYGDQGVAVQLAGWLDEVAMATEAQYFHDARPALHLIDPRHHHDDYSYYQLAEGATPPLYEDNPAWTGDRRQCVTTTNRVLRAGIPGDRPHLRDLLGSAPLSPRYSIQPGVHEKQPWLTREVYQFCLANLTDNNDG